MATSAAASAKETAAASGGTFRASTETTTCDCVWYHSCRTLLTSGGGGAAAVADASVGRQHGGCGGEERGGGVDVGEHLGQLTDEADGANHGGLSLRPAALDEGRPLAPEPPQHHVRQAGLDRLELLPERARAVPRQEDGPSRDEGRANLLVPLRALDAQVEDGRRVLLQLGELARAPQRGEEARRVLVGGAAREKLLKDAEHHLDLVEDEGLALGRVGAEQPHERGHVARSLPHGRREERRKELRVGVAKPVARLEQLREHLEDVRRELGDVHLEDGLEGREEELLERVDGGGRRGADVLDERRDRLEEVVVEGRVGRVGAHAAEDRVERVDADLHVRRHRLLGDDADAHDRAHHVRVLLRAAALQDGEERGEQLLQQGGERRRVEAARARRRGGGRRVADGEEPLDGGSGVGVHDRVWRREQREEEREDRVVHGARELHAED
mmetsp:Transcript_3154/g.10428  ORF Transcript_3154/g.10428 Transcript_3154/m.10428 type:complete len:444 (-) Transcript_3154:1528-2859(-)